MRDFNFFDPYIKVQDKPNKSRIIIVILIMLVIALMLFYQFMLNLKVKGIQADIAKTDTFINSPDIVSKIKTIETKQVVVNDLQQIFANVAMVSAELELSDNLDDMLIEQINAQLPENAFLTELSMNNQVITIKGYSIEYNNIAQFAFNLRDSGLYNVLIPSITENNGSYLYTITAAVVLEVSNEN